LNFYETYYVAHKLWRSGLRRCWGKALCQGTYNIGIPDYRIINGERSGVGYSAFGFRIYAIGEPSTLFLLGLGAVMLRRKRRAK